MGEEPIPVDEYLAGFDDEKCREHLSALIQIDEQMLAS
tara:strand:+ start:361 stop:474 length:114 start_codon:yes stop_codon:yes gene_type:complete